jgi:hypothetical protein
VAEKILRSEFSSKYEAFVGGDALISASVVRSFKFINQLNLISLFAAFFDIEKFFF